VVIEIITVITAALDMASSEEGTLPTFDEMLKIWTKPVLSEDDQFELEDRGWEILFPGYLVSKYEYVTTDESAAQGDYAEVDEVYVGQVAQTLEEAIDDNESWIEAQEGTLRSEQSMDSHTGDWTEYSLHIKRIDGEDLGPEEIDFIFEKTGAYR